MLALFTLMCMQPTEPNLADSAKWVKENAIAFTTPAAGSGFDDLKGLDAIVGDARIVALGEPTHGTREAFQMKHRLLEYLVENKGFSIFSIEASMPEAYALSDYVIHGKGDPKKLIAGMYFWTWNTQEVLDMVEWMRAWNQKNPPEAGKPRLQFTGFDMQTPDVAWAIVRDFAAQHDAELLPALQPLIKDLRALQARASLGSTQSGWTSATGSFPVEAAAGKKLTLSVWARTEGVTGWAGAWWRCDTPAGVKGFNNMNDKGITGNSDWKRHEFTIDVPKDTNNINFGFILTGDGTVWFDDMEVTLDGVKYSNPELFSFDFENDDVKFLTGGSGEYALSRSETKPHSGKKCLEIRRRPESEVPRVDAREIHARCDQLLDAMTARRDALAAKAGAWPTDWAIQNARILRQNAAMYMSDQGFNTRDLCMAENVAWILNQNPNAKIVLWAHNGHVARTDNMAMSPMGGHLARGFRDRMVVFGFATGSGQYTAMPQGGGGLKRDLPLEQPPAGSVEQIFEAAGLDNAILDIRRASPDDPGSAWATASKRMRSIGALEMKAQFFPTVPKSNYDVLVWQRRTTASQPIK